MSLRIENVTHRYSPRDRVVLDDVTVSFEAGNLAALVGPSGSGKSTLLAVVGGLLTPTSGTVRLCGTRAGRSGSASRLLAATAWVFQSSYMLPCRTALANVMLALRTQGQTRTVATAQARHLLDLVELSHRCEARIEELSGGEIQRVALARALAMGRTLLLADEPTAQLDRTSATIVMRALRATANAGALVIVATHDLQMAEACDTVLRLVDGRLRSTVRPDDSR